jgi:hypothetical protein
MNSLSARDFGPGGLGRILMRSGLQEVREEPCIEVSKSQFVRLVDIFAMGPLLLWFGVKGTSFPAWARLAILWSGVGTIAYNAKNYLETREREYADKAD